MNNVGDPLSTAFRVRQSQGEPFAEHYWKQRDKYPPGSSTG